MDLIFWRDSASICVHLFFTTSHTTIFPFPDTRSCSTMRKWMLCSRNHLICRELGPEPQAAWGGHHSMLVGKGRSLPVSSWLLLLFRQRDRETVAVAGKSLRRVWLSSSAKISWYSSGWAD